jgi:hypothetical protein
VTPKVIKMVKHPDGDMMLEIEGHGVFVARQHTVIPR